jgi:pyruvate kinase
MQIIATISKNSYQPEKIAEIVTAGANILRYNLSHGSPEKQIAIVASARAVIARLSKTGQVKILADLPGLKIRLGEFSEQEYHVSEGDTVTFKSAKSSPTAAKFIPIDYPHVGKCVAKDQIITIADGEIGLKVIKIVNSNSFQAVALNSHKILQFKGVHLGFSMDSLDQLSAITPHLLTTVAAINPEIVAFSFVNSVEYLTQAKKLVYAALPQRPLVMAKIETEKGLTHLAQITKHVDYIMVARGDMGVSMPFDQLGISQKHIVSHCKKHHIPVIVATQILSSLLNSYLPTRAEILDLTNIVLDGADGILLANETGLSLTPGHSITVARSIIENVQKYVSRN